MKKLISPVLIILLLSGVCLSAYMNSVEETASITFRRITLTKDFIAEGVAIGDVNRDGHIDILSGAYWFEGPAWNKHEIDKPQRFYPDTAYSNAFMCFSLDVNKDGWIDFVRIGIPGSAGFWYENPKGSDQHWVSRLIHPAVGNEAVGFYDIDRDGSIELLCADSKAKKVIWLEPDAKSKSGWPVKVISDDPLLATHQYTHGLGFGDINGDGRNDILIKEGWWEAPQNGSEENWRFHHSSFGADCAQMYTLDVDLDGDNDVITSSAHDFGIWWHEQQRTNTNTAWKTHEISKLFSQSHGLLLKDVNGDGHPDLITGKRYYAHNGNDPGAHDPAVFYWYEFKPGKKPHWIPHLIDSTSGAGLTFVAEDLNKDGLIDIVVSNKKGLHLFQQKQ